MLSLQGHGGGVAFVLKKMDTILGKSSELMLGDLAVFPVMAPQKMLRKGLHLSICVLAN